MEYYSVTFLGKSFLKPKEDKLLSCQKEKAIYNMTSIVLTEKRKKLCAWGKDWTRIFIGRLFGGMVEGDETEDLGLTEDFLGWRWYIDNIFRMLVTHLNFL